MKPHKNAKDNTIIIIHYLSSELEFFYKGDYRMTIQEIVTIELPAVVQTINEYTMEHYVRHYTNLLMSYRSHEQKQDMLPIINRLIEWYGDNMSEIEHNKYIYNKHEHKKSFELLIELQELIKEG
jgi:hypothetical protein